jgi:hypothetical protein
MKRARSESANLYYGKLVKLPIDGLPAYLYSHNNKGAQQIWIQHPSGQSLTKILITLIPMAGHHYSTVYLPTHSKPDQEARAGP